MIEERTYQLKCSICDRTLLSIEEGLGVSLSDKNGKRVTVTEDDVLEISVFCPACHLSSTKEQDTTHLVKCCMEHTTVGYNEIIRLRGIINQDKSGKKGDKDGDTPNSSKR